jgi:protein FAM161A
VSVGVSFQHKNYRNMSASSSNSRTASSLELQSINRSNLAAVLRIQSARKRLETEMSRRLEEIKLKEEARWREKLMRKKPVWQTLAYSHEEDLAMRLQLRRDEEKLRSEEHKLRMQLMLGRVNQQPTLFERQSQVVLVVLVLETIEEFCFR